MHIIVTRTLSIVIIYYCFQQDSVTHLFSNSVCNIYEAIHIIHICVQMYVPVRITASIASIEETMAFAPPPPTPPSPWCCSAVVNWYADTLKLHAHSWWYIHSRRCQSLTTVNIRIFFIDLITLFSLLTHALGEYQLEIRICLWYVNDGDVVQNHVFEPCGWMNY